MFYRREGKVGLGAKGLDGDGGFQLASGCGLRAGVGSWGSWICVSGSKPVDMSMDWTVWVCHRKVRFCGTL